MPAVADPRPAERSREPGLPTATGTGSGMEAHEIIPTAPLIDLGGQVGPNQRASSGYAAVLVLACVLQRRSR